MIELPYYKHKFFDMDRPVDKVGKGRNIITNPRMDWHLTGNVAVTVWSQVLGEKRMYPDPDMRREQTYRHTKRETWGCPLAKRVKHLMRKSHAGIYMRFSTTKDQEASFAAPSVRVPVQIALEKHQQSSCSHPFLSIHQLVRLSPLIPEPPVGYGFPCTDNLKTPLSPMPTFPPLYLFASVTYAAVNLCISCASFSLENVSYDRLDCGTKRKPQLPQVQLR